jgi:antitoxin FitA
LVASLNIRQLDPALKERLRVRAARNGRSMEAEARVIIKEALSGADEPLTTGAELELPPRGPAREPPSFG